MKIYIVHEWIPYEGYWNQSYFRDLHDALIHWQYLIGDQVDRKWLNTPEKGYHRALDLEYDNLAEAIRDEDNSFYERWEIIEVEVL